MSFFKRTVNIVSEEKMKCVTQFCLKEILLNILHKNKYILVNELGT